MGTGETIAKFLTTTDFQQFVFTDQIFFQFFQILWYNLIYLLPWFFYLMVLILLAIVSLAPIIWIVKALFFPKI